MENTDLPCDVCGANAEKRCQPSCSFYEADAVETRALHEKIRTLESALAASESALRDERAARQALTHDVELVNGLLDREREGRRVAEEQRDAAIAERTRQVLLVGLEVGKRRNAEAEADRLRLSLEDARSIASMRNPERAAQLTFAEALAAEMRVKLDLAAEIVGDSAAAHERAANLVLAFDEQKRATAKALREAERRIRTLIKES